tara:strand:+ start:1448 stop:1597 length:150 start_codon:yes stop_codon:yes gene_type:complete
MGSEVVHDSIESCQQHYNLILEEVAKVDSVEIKLSCVSSGIIEDYILQL